MKKGLALLIVLVLVIVSFAGCGEKSEVKDEIILLEGQFSEVDIMMQMTGILIEENTDLEVSFHDSMATVAAANALEAKEVDVAMGYDGTLLTTILGHDPSDVPEGEKLFDYTKALGAKERGLTLTEKFGFENTYALAIKKELAEEHNIEAISDLQPYTKDLVFGAEHEFFDEEGTMRFNPFNAYYELEWKDSKSIDIGLKYAAMDSGNIDVTMVYSTDGLNKKSELVILKDDLSFFPEYYGSHMVRDTIFEEFAESAPNLEEVLLMLEGQISNEEMIEMNYQADAEGKDPYDIAKAFLEKKGLID